MKFLCFLAFQFFLIELCQSTCTPANYQYSNASCMPTCPAPFTASTKPTGLKVCTSPCANGQFIYPDLTCEDACPSPLSSKVQSVLSYCWTPCSATEYLYADGSCGDCSSPFVQKTEFNIQFCDHPCSDPNDFFYPDGTCQSTCPSPLLQQTEPQIQFCSSPCSSTQFLFANGTCGACSSPLVEKTESGIQYCSNPCGSDYVYPNGDCQSSCPYPLRSDPDVKECWSPCYSSTQFLYTNESCLTCTLPFVQKTESGVQYCNNPCGSSFLYPDATCQSSCPSPLLSRTESGVNFCWSHCSSTQYLYANGSCGACPLPLSIQTVSGIQYCNNPCGNDFLYPDGTCQSSCSAPLLSRSEPGVKFCWSPCSLFLYANGSCLACPLPFITQTVNNIKYCKTPCGNLYMNSDGNCQSSCPSPLRSDPDVKYCWNPCSTNQYLYPNSTCSSVCDLPLAINIQPEAKYCENPCPNFNDFLYPDGSCSNQCPDPLSNRIEPVSKFCFPPCAGPPSDIYLYPDGSCLPNCYAPYIKSQFYNVDQCSSPCQDPQKEYFYEIDQECKATCTSPYESKTVNGVKFCSQKPQETLNEIDETKKRISSVKSQRTVTETGMKTLSVLSSRKPSFSWLSGQDTMLYYIRYINLNYTQKLKLVLSLQGENPFDFTVEIEMPRGLEEKLRDRELPEIFEFYEVHSNFFNNSWDMLTSFLLVLGIILGLSFVKIFTAATKFTRIDKILAKALASLKWNTLLMVILGSFGQVFFDASLQLQASFVDSPWEIVSLVLAILMILVGLVILALGGKIVKDIWKNRNVESCVEEMEKKWKNFGLFFEGYQKNSLASFGCMVIFLSRTVVFNLIIANLYNYPFMQSILINVVTFVMVGYMINKRPLKDTLEFVQLFLNEIFVVAVNTCALIIAIMDKADIKGKDLRNDVCNTIILIIEIFAAFNLACFVIQILIAFISFVKLLRRLKAEGKLSLRGILSSLLFGDEEHVAIKNKDNKLPVRVHPETEISQSESLHVTEDINITKMNETENCQAASEIFIPRRFYRPLHISDSWQNFRYLDRSAVPAAEESFHRTWGLNPYQNELLSDRNRQKLTLESNGRESVVFPVDPVETLVQGKPDLGYPDTFSQFQKMRNHLRRNQE